MIIDYITHNLSLYRLLNVIYKMQKVAANTTLVNVDPDITITFNEFFSRLIGVEGTTFSNDCKVLIENGDNELLIAKYIENIDSIFGLDDEKDVESCIQAIVSIIFSIKDDINAVTLIKKVIDKVSFDQSSKQKLRLKSLVSLLNLSFTDDSKFYALTG